MNIKIYNLNTTGIGWEFLIELVEYGIKIPQCTLNHSFSNLDIPEVRISNAHLRLMEKEISERIKKYVEQLPKEI